MRLSLGTNFDNDLLEQIADTKVKVVYGKLPQDIFGGGRPTISLPEVTKDHLINHIKLAHSLGKEFNYLLNTNCMDNLEFRSDINKEIYEFIAWLDEIGVDWITVSIPYFIPVIKHIAPRIKVSLSTFAYVDTLQKALAFEKMGVDEITLPEGLNRNFKLLKLFTQNLKCEIQLIATNLCLAACPYRIYHSNSQSHASQRNHVSNGVTFDYCMLNCTAKTLESPAEFIKIPWIRPEDLHVYEEIGISSIKLTERMKKTERLVEIAKAYSDRKYEGDLNRLLNFRIKGDFITPNHDLLEGADMYNVECLIESRELLFQRDVEICNKQLDGFIDYFVNKDTDCRNELCGITCKYCDKYAAKAIKSDWKDETMVSNNIREFLKKVVCGAMSKVDDRCDYIWNDQLNDKLNSLLLKKPEFIRSSIRRTIIKAAEDNAHKYGRNEILLEDLLIANYLNTPKEFRINLKDEMIRLNIEVPEED